jgi:hypothetical protein
MADHLQFMVSEIAKAGDTFSREGAAYRGGMPYDGTKCPFGCPRAGEALVDHLLENALRMIGEVHVEIGQAMENHGTKLNLAAEHYATVESRLTAHIDDLFRYAETSPLPPDLPHE